MFTMKQDRTSCLEASPFFFFCFRIVILRLCVGEQCNKPKLSADHTPANFALDVAKQFWAILSRVKLSIDETVFGNVTGSVNKDVTKSFTGKKKLYRVRASEKCNFRVLPALVSSGNKVRDLPASLDEVTLKTRR